MRVFGQLASALGVVLGVIFFAPFVLAAVIVGIGSFAADQVRTFFSGYSMAR